MLYILSKLHVNECNVGQVICWDSTIMPIHLSQYYNVIPLRGVIDTLPTRVLRRVMRPAAGIRILKHLRFNNDRRRRLIYHPTPFNNNEERMRIMESEDAVDTINGVGWSDGATDDHSASGSDEE